MGRAIDPKNIELWELQFAIGRFNELGRERLQLILIELFPNITPKHLLEASLYQSQNIYESDGEIEIESPIDFNKLYAYLQEKGYINVQ
jgi:hypothetical protein